MLKLKEKIKDLSPYMIVVAFLALEVIAFLSFSLGFSYLLYGILGLVLIALLILVSLKEIKSDGLISCVLFAYPLVIFALLAVISTYTRYYLGENIISMVDVVFIPISLTVFAFIGYFLSLNNKFKVSTAVTVAFSALALYCFINLIATMIQFGPFYPMLYPNSKFYYGGEVSPNVSSIAYALIGFNICEVSMSFYTFFPILLLASAIGLFIIKPKEKPYLFVAYAGFTLIALLSLIFTFNKISLISLILMVILLALIVIYIKIRKQIVKKIYKICFIVGVVLFGLYLLITFFNAQEEWAFVSGLQNMLKSNKVLNKVFNANRISEAFKNYFVNLLKFSSDGNKFFGFVCYNSIGTVTKYVEVQSSYFFLIDNLATSGVIGALFFLIFFITGIKNVIKFFHNDDVEQNERILLLTFVFAYFVALILNNTFDVGVFATLKSNYYMQGMFLVVIIFMSYAYNYQAKYKVKKKEETDSHETQE